MLCTHSLHAVYPGHLKQHDDSLSQNSTSLLHKLLCSERGRLIEKAENKQKRHTPGKRKGHFLVPVKRPRPILGCKLANNGILVSGSLYQEMFSPLTHNKASSKKTFRFLILKSDKLSDVKKHVVVECIKILACQNERCYHQ